MDITNGAWQLVEAENLIWNGMFANKAFLNGVVVWAKQEIILSIDKVNVILSKANGFRSQVEITATKPFTIYELQ